MKVTNVPHLRQREELRPGQRDGIVHLPLDPEFPFLQRHLRPHAQIQHRKVLHLALAGGSRLVERGSARFGRPSCGPPLFCRYVSVFHLAQDTLTGHATHPNSGMNSLQPTRPTWPTRPQRPCRPAIRPGGVLTTPPRRFSAQAKQSWPPSATGPTPWQCRSSALVAGELQASCKPVASLLEASSFSLPPRPHAEPRYVLVGGRLNGPLAPRI